MNINFVCISDVVAHRERKAIDLSAVGAFAVHVLEAQEAN